MRKMTKRSLSNSSTADVLRMKLARYIHPSIMPSELSTMLRSNKSLLFALAGLIGGSAGALLAEIVPEIRGRFVRITLFTGLWSGIFAAVLTLALFCAHEFYLRKTRPDNRTLLQALRIGFLSGGLSGLLAQTVFSFGQSDTFFGQVVFRSFCWAIMGALLGWRLSKSVPNLGTRRGVLGGALGGFVGGLGFLFSTVLLPETVGRMFGVGLLGAALGLGIVAAERLWREASLDVIWAPREITSLTLGGTPLWIGGGDDHVFIRGLPPHACSLLLENGKVQYTDSASGQRTEFRDGSRIKIGMVELLVHARS